MKAQHRSGTRSLQLGIVLALIIFGLTACAQKPQPFVGGKTPCGQGHKTDVPVTVTGQDPNGVTPKIFIACGDDIVHWDSATGVTDFTIQFDLPNNDPDPFQDNKHGRYSKNDPKTGHARKVTAGTYKYLEYTITVTVAGQTHSYSGDPGGIIMQ